MEYGVTEQEYDAFVRGLHEKRGIEYNHQRVSELKARSGLSLREAVLYVRGRTLEKWREEQRRK